MTPEGLINIAQAHGLALGVIPGSARPYYTVAEVGIGLAGLPKDERERCFAAFAWREIADLQQRRILYAHLTKEIYMGYGGERKDFVPVSMYEGWPEKIANQRYMDRLIRMALDEDRMTRHAEEPFVLDPVHPLFDMVIESYGFKDITELVWKRRLSKKYMTIRSIILTWHGEARYNTYKKLGGEEGVA